MTRAFILEQTIKKIGVCVLGSRVGHLARHKVTKVIITYF